MNVHASNNKNTVETPQRSDSLDNLRQWLSEGARRKLTDEELEAIEFLIPKAETYPVFKTEYPHDFEVSKDYAARMPDLQNGPAAMIKGAHQSIQHVGISNFRLPLKFKKKDGGEMTLETSVTGSVSLDADKKGINMSRIMRSFYKYSETTFSFEVIESALEDYRENLDTFDARIMLRLSFPQSIGSLRSNLKGFQYYDIGVEVVDKNNVRSRYLHLDYVYSSTCPCSLELSEHARKERNQLATPHSQRSVARVSVEILDGPMLWFEDLIDICRSAVPTETQVMVKREDEQAFAEMNAANPIFVEDAVRLFCKELKTDDRIGDFRVIASHQESLHSHDAISIMCEGPTFDQNTYDPKMFSSLIHVG